MASCKTCKTKFNPFSVFSFLRTTARKHSFSKNGTRSNLKKLRKTLKLKGGWKRKPRK